MTKAWTVERYTKHAGGSPLIAVEASRNKAFAFVRSNASNLGDILIKDEYFQKIRDGYYMLEYRGVTYIIRRWVL